MNFRLTLIFTLLFTTLLTAKTEEYGVPFIKNYSPTDYTAYPQNWAVVQDLRGVMYFGNNDGVLEYDGKNWQKIEVSNKSTVRSLATDSNGVVYVGAQNEFGLLSPDKTGKLEYVSLSSSLDSLSSIFSDVWKTVCTPDGIYFYSKERLFLFRQDSIKVWELEKGYLFSFYVEGKLLLGHYSKGLMQLVNDSLAVVKGGDTFTEMNIFSILPLTKGELLIATFANGLYHYSFQTEKAEPFATEADQFLRNNQLYSGVKLPDGKFLFGTLRNGAVLLNKHGDVVQYINKITGLQDETIIHLYNPNDNQGYFPIWAALNQGISSIEINSPWRTWNETTGLSGAVYDIIRYQEILYVATSLGVYYLDVDSGGAQFVKINNLDTQVWCFLEINNRLFVGTSLGIYELADSHAKLFRESHYTYKLFRLKKDRTKILAGLGDGLALINCRKGKLEYQGKINGIKEEVRSIAEDSDGTVWIGTLVDGIYRVAFSKPGLKDKTFIRASDYPVSADVKHYDLSSGLPSLKDINIYQFDSRLLFATEKGLYKYDELNDTFIPDTTLGTRFADGTRGVFRFLEDDAGNCWINPFNSESEWIERIIKQDNGRYYPDPVPFNRLPLMSVQTFYNDYDHITWIGGSEGIFSFNDSLSINYQQTFYALIRMVIAGDDSVIFNGTNYKVSDDGSRMPRISWLEQPDLLKPVLKYFDNHLVFHYSAPYYIEEQANQYSYKLEGFDKRWSNWTSETKKEYTNIPEGNYVFRVIARNIFGTESKEARYEFSILPPWYRTYWAYAVYLMIAVLAVWGIVRLNTHRLRLQKERLEEIVRQRTAQIRKQKEIIELEKEKSDKLLLNILPAKVAEDLKHTGKTEPESFDEVTVYFSDVVGFTNMSTKLEPKYLIDELNDIFTAFDNIMEKHSCERIKTIGDAYLAVCGMPVRNPEHVTNIIDAAIAIRDYLIERNKTNDLEWKIRIGIHTGKLVGGVVGIKKYIYDVFGDTINTSSRMESNSEPMRINISETTYELVKNKYKIIRRAPLHVKGKGKMNMYFVESRIAY